MTATKKYREGATVTIREGFQSDDGCWVEAGAEGTLMTDVGDGDWLVYIPAKGSPCVNAGNFE